MEEPIVDPKYEFEAPQFVNFNKLLGDEDENVDSWFDGRPGDEGGIQIPIDVDETELQKDGDSTRPKRANVVDVDVDIAKLQEAPLISIGEAQPTAITAPIKTENIQKSVVANPNDKSLIQPDTNVENNQNTTELKSETKHITESDQGVVCEQSSMPQNDTELKLVDLDKNQVEQDNNTELNSQESVQQTGSDQHVETAEESPTECNEKAESDVESQKEAITTSSENGNSTEEEAKKEQPKEHERRVTRASKRNRSLNPGANGIHNKRQKRSGGGSMQSKRTRSMCSNPEAEIKGHSITIPVTPQCMKRQKTNKPSMIKLKTTEELEMECIAKLRKQTKHHIKVNENLMKKAISCPARNAVRATDVSLTRPQEFHFQTDTRVKQHAMTTRADQPAVDLSGEDMEKEFWKGLRQHPPSPSWKHRTATIPKPFNLSDGGQKKRKHSAMDTDGLESDSYQTMAYQVYKFQTTTPPRFRTRKANDSGFKFEIGHEKMKGVTLPKTPNLSTKARARPVAEDVLNKEEREEKVVEEMKNYKFKAKPLDRRVIESDGMYGVKKPEETIPATKPKPFLFESDERLVARKDKEPDNQEEAVNFKAMPQPSFEKVFRPQLKHERTAPKPFSFEDKDKERWQKKDEKIQDVYKEEERLREFKAQPLPSDSPDRLPAVSSKSGTSFKPFALNTDNRGAKKAERWIQKVRSELEECRSKATFKAKPCKVLQDAPFMPQKSTKPLTEVSQFVLNTIQRSERREELETTKKEREQIDEELRKQRDAEREVEEQEALVLLRKNLVHKAQPIHKYKKVKVKPSSKPLTDAHSPAWSEMKRRRVETQR